MISNKRESKKETFMQSILVLMASQVMIKLLGLLYKLYLTNKDGFGDTGNAIYNSGYQIYALLLAISSIGVPNAISKIISERLAKGDSKGVRRVFKIAIAFFSLIGLIGTLLLFFGANYIANVWLQIPEAELTLVALSPSIFFVSILSVIRGYFNGHQRMKITANSQSLEQVAKTVLTILVVELISVFATRNVVLMAAGANLATTLSVLLSFLYLYRFYNLKKGKLREEESKQELVGESYTRKSRNDIIKAILTISIPMSISSLVSTINKTIDSVTAVRGLKVFLSEEMAKFQYGIYTGKVDTLVGLPLSFNIAFATVLVPSIAKLLAKGEKKDAVDITKFSLLTTILIGLPCTFGMIVFSDQILHLLFPNAPEGTLLLQITSLTIIFMMMAQTINGALQGIGKSQVPAIALGCGVFVKLILNIVLIPIPSIGINGIAIASIICHLISFAIGFTVLKNSLRIKFSFTDFVLKPIIATGIMCITSYGLYAILAGIISWKIALIVAILFAIAAYIVIVLVMKIFNKDDIYRLPKGEKIYKFLVKSGVYSE